MKGLTVLKRIALTAVVLFSIAVLVITIRYMKALEIVKSVEQDFQKIEALEMGSTASLQIVTLYEAWAATNDFQSGHGVAYLLKLDHTSILMDLGNNEQDLDPSPLIYNMRQLDVDLNDIEMIVISHNHPDHVGGLKWWRKGSFFLGSGQELLDVKNIFLPVELEYPAFQPQVVNGPLVLAPGVATLGILPFIQPFPIWLWEPLGWEQSLAVNIEGVGLVLVSGCGHAGLENIIERAETVLDIPVKGIFGGFHYLNASAEDLAPQINFLADRDPLLVALSPHDSGGSVLQLFEVAFPEAYRYILIGSTINIYEQQ